MVTQELQLFLELFPVESDSLPPLTAYRVLMDGGDAAKIGGKLAFRLRQLLPGNWAWAGNRLLTDTPPNPVKLLMAVDEARKAQPKTYGNLGAVEQDYAWQPAPDMLAEYVLRGPMNSLEDRMREALARTAFPLGNAAVEREHHAEAWVVNGQPAISFSVVTRLIYDADLYNYAATVGKPGELVGLRVADKNSTMQGEILKVVGKMGEHRERLVALSQREATRELLRSAPDDDVVVRVASGQNEYDYCGSALQLVVGLGDTRRFEVNPVHAAKALRLKPSLRAQMVKAVADVAKAENLIGNAFSTQNAPEPFITVNPALDVALGSNRTRPYDVERLPFDFMQYGAYWQRERFQREPVRIAVLNALSESVDDFREALQRSIERDFGFSVEFIKERKVKVVSQTNLESAARVLQKEPLDLVLAFVENSSDDEDDDGAGDYFIKAQTIGRGLPCLVIHESTLHKPEAMPSLIMGILARAGNAPYLFDEPLDFCDYVVGLDTFRERRKDGETLTGVARIYRSDGAFLYYRIASASQETGEGIPAEVLTALFPADVFSGKRVVIHNEGRFRREALRALGGWEAGIEATFYPVEIIRRGVPRMYAFEHGKIVRPPYGSAFRLNEREAFLVTAKSPEDATPQPLYIRTELPLTIEQAVQSVLAFTMLHYGALQTPKLPVTTHHTDYIRLSILRDILPDALEGEIAFWL